MRPARPLPALLAFAILVLGASFAHAGKDGPGTKAVKAANTAITKLLAKEVEAGSAEEKKLAAEVTVGIRDFLDVDELGQRALADHWSGLQPDQREEYLTLLRGLIEDNYVKGLRANLEYKVVYQGETKQKDGTRLVKTEIKTKRRGRAYTIKVAYVLKQASGKWKAYDVSTDGVGLVENYRAQFNKIISKDGFEGLIAKMKKKKRAA